jgi:hypothetical protein
LGSIPTKEAGIDAGLDVNAQVMATPAPAALLAPSEATTPVEAPPVHVIGYAAVRSTIPQSVLIPDGEHVGAVTTMSCGAMTVFPENAGTVAPAAPAVIVSPPLHDRLPLLNCK